MKRHPFFRIGTSHCWRFVPNLWGVACERLPHLSRRRCIPAAQRTMSVSRHPAGASALPPRSFLDSRADRVELARQRFFDEGLLPTGVVSEAVFQSWSRCLRRRLRPGDVAVFEPVTISRAQLALQKNTALLLAWQDVAPRLEATLGATACAAMLTDPTGVVVGARCAGRAHEALMPVAARVGVNLSEDAVGTTAPGVVARTGKALVVLGADHFFDNVKAMHCAAAPIRDVTGAVAGVLDLSSEAIPFGFDALTLALVYASEIENRLLVAQSNDHLVVRFQVSPELLDAASVGLVGVDAHGRLAWHNGVARSLLGLPASPGQRAVDLEGSFGLAPSRLAALPSQGATLLALPNGLQVWARAEWRSADGAHRGVTGARSSAAKTRGSAAHEIPATARVPQLAQGAAEAPQPSQVAGGSAGSATAAVQPLASGMPPAGMTMRAFDRELVARALQASQGNVSQAARSLGVSRNFIYRRLKDG